MSSDFCITLRCDCWSWHLRLGVGSNRDVTLCGSTCDICCLWAGPWLDFSCGSFHCVAVNILVYHFTEVQARNKVFTKRDARVKDAAGDTKERHPSVVIVILRSLLSQGMLATATAFVMGAVRSTPPAASAAGGGAAVPQSYEISPYRSSCCTRSVSFLVSCFCCSLDVVLC